MFYKLNIVDLSEKTITKVNIMGKISPVADKYIVHASIEIDGVVDKPDVIGAIFGQTEGLLGSDLELRELQRSGRIGRIEVNIDTRGGKSQGSIIIPSSMDKTETSIVAAALEIIQRIGPCNAKIKVGKIEDIRITKRAFVISRAKELLRNLIDTSSPDSQELSEEVSNSVRVMEIVEYGKDRVPAGPSIDDSEEIIVVEGRADVLNLLKNGIKNSIAINGTSVPDTIKELCRRKTVTVFVDGDRGGNMIVRELLAITDIDFVTRAPDGKEVEELTKKELHKALRSRVAPEQIKSELERNGSSGFSTHDQQSKTPTGPVRRMERPGERPMRHTTGPSGTSAPHRTMDSRYPPKKEFSRAPIAPVRLKPEEKKTFRDLLENLIGTRGASILDAKFNTLGKVPLSELASTLRSLTTGVYAIIFDGIIDREIVSAAEKADVKYLIAMDTKVKPSETKLNLITISDL